MHGVVVLFFSFLRLVTTGQYGDTDTVEIVELVVGHDELERRGSRVIGASEA